MLNSLIKETELQNVVACSSKGTRDYNLGERPDANVIEVAEDLGLNIKDHTARFFDCAKDVVEYDLLLVMDKFTASDAMKEVTIYETIDKDNEYCWKVRRLGDFCLARKIEDIDDPLYGNVGGQEEVEELHRVALDIQDSCSGLAKFLSDVQSNSKESQSLKKAIAWSMGQMAPTDWVAPPMLART